MLFRGVRVRPSLQVAVLLAAFLQHSRCEKYIDKYGYLKWNSRSNILQGAETRLEFRFRYCNNKGVLIYQQGEGRNFFALGVNDERLYIEASIDGLAVEMYVGESVRQNQNHDVTIIGLRTLSSQTRFNINGIAYTPEGLTDVVVNLDFTRSILIGETLIGGYATIDHLRLRTQRLKAYPITCITFLRAGQTDIDLNNPSSQLGVSDECVVCLPPSTVTLTKVTSYLKMRVDNTPRFNTVISLKFRTKAPDGLLFYFGGPAYMALYLEGGALVLRLNTRGTVEDANYKTTRMTFNDGEMQEVLVTRYGDEANLRDGVGNVHAIFGGAVRSGEPLNAEFLYVGGFPDANCADISENIQVRQSFRGCLEDLRFASYSAVEEAPTKLNFKTENDGSRDVDFSACLESASCPPYSCTREAQRCSLGVCECIHGYGVRSQDPLLCYNIDDCTPNPCQNGAVCTDKIADYNCTCTDRYKGKNCSSIRNCYDFPCLNGVQCIELNTTTPSAAGRICSCAPGYKGEDCGEDCDECSEQCNSGMCVNYISCENRFGDFICECEPGYEWKNCSKEIDRPVTPIQLSPANLAAIFVGLIILLVLVIVAVAFRRQIVYRFQKCCSWMSQQGTQVQGNTRNTITQGTVRESIGLRTLVEVTYMGLQQPNPHADTSTQTGRSAPSEDHAYQSLSRETMEGASGYTSMRPTKNKAISSPCQGEDDYEHPNQDNSSQEGGQTYVNESIAEPYPNQQDEYGYEIVL
ncbi:uncharacterized protein LOC144885449 [Branchiostoma floridae x Branchiostoma japonicum]